MKKPRISARQVGGNDGFCWAVFINGAIFMEGLTRREVPYWKKRALQHAEAACS
jgi:hypothetical protein